MPRHGENIYKRRDGRYEGRYVIGKTATGKTKIWLRIWLLLCASKEETFAKEGHAASDSCIDFHCEQNYGSGMDNALVGK